MDLESLLSAEDQAFLAEVRAFLAAELEPSLVVEDDAQRTSIADRDRGMRWFERLRPRRWHAAHWPAEHGGAGLTPRQNYLLLYASGRAGAPHLPPMGLNYVGPTLVRYGTPDQQATLMPGILSGRDYWCQGFSEPGAGSDLGAVATFARRDGDHFVVDGSKIWTTDAHHANWIFCLVRTSRADDKRALSFLLVDMRSPGVTVRPIRLLSGDHEVNQVFFDSVAVPAGNLLGGEGEGWAVARFLLELERGAFVFGGRMRRRFELTVARAREAGVDEAAFWATAARLDVDLLAYELTEFRLGPASGGGVAALAPASVIKIAWSEIWQRIDALGLAIADGAFYRAAGPLLAHGHELAMPGWLASYFNNRAATIYGASNEVQRNLIWRGLQQAWR